MSEFRANVLFDSVTANTGDEAIGIASMQIFNRLGLDASIISPFASRMPSPLVIGGGELIRNAGDNFYDYFRQPGEHILNSAGVWRSANSLDYLNAYRFVSARSSTEAEVLSAAVRDVQVIPCGTTLLESPDIDIPGIEEGEPVVGVHVVPHSLRQIDNLTSILDEIPHRKVLIPFTHYNRDISFMEHLPFDKSRVVQLGRMSPLELHAVMRRMTMVLVTSLHASIFAYSQNVPFVSIHQEKVSDYFRDRGLGSQIADDEVTLRDAVHRTLTEPPDMRKNIASDRSQVEAAYSRYVDMIRAAKPTDGDSHGDHSVKVTSLFLDQASHVIADRDLAIAHSEHRRAQAIAELQSRLAEIAALETRSALADRLLARHDRAPWRRLSRFLARVGRRLARLRTPR